MSDGSVYMLDEPWLELLADQLLLLLLLLLLLRDQNFAFKLFWGVFVLFPK